MCFTEFAFCPGKRSHYENAIFFSNWSTFNFRLFSTTCGTLKKMRCFLSVEGAMERHNHRFVVDCGKPSVVAIFLLHMPAVAIFSTAKSSCADRTILVAKIPTSTLDLSQMWLWCIDWCQESVMCVGVQCAKTCCFDHIFNGGESIFHQKRAQNKHDFKNVGPPFSILRFLGKATYIYIKKGPKHSETRSPKRERLRASRPPCTSAPVPFCFVVSWKKQSTCTW